MVSLDIRLHSLDSVSAFVNLVNRYPFHIDLRQGRAIVDAKSILGVLSLDRERPVVVDIYSDACSELMDALDRYAG